MPVPSQTGLVSEVVIFSQQACLFACQRNYCGAKFQCIAAIFCTAKVKGTLSQASIKPQATVKKSETETPPEKPASEAKVLDHINTLFYVGTEVTDCSVWYSCVYSACNTPVYNYCTRMVRLCTLVGKWRKIQSQDVQLVGHSISVWDALSVYNKVFWLCCSI